jgi:hypothetical protein
MQTEHVVEIVDGLADNAVLLRGSTGNVRDGTPVKLVGVSPAAAPASRAPAA